MTRISRNIVEKINRRLAYAGCKISDLSNIPACSIHEGKLNIRLVTMRNSPIGTPSKKVREIIKSIVEKELYPMPIVYN